MRKPTTTVNLREKAGLQGLPQGWRLVRLGDHVTKIGSGITPRGGHKTYLRSGIPLIRSQNVHLCRFEPDGLAFISPEQDEDMAGSRVQPADVLLNITGASIGRVCVVPLELCPANVNQHVCIIRTNGTLDPESLAYHLASPAVQESIMDSQAGATRQALTKALIEQFTVPWCEIHHQRRIAARLRGQLAAIAEVRAAVQAQADAAADLPAAQLRAAFASANAARWPTCRLGDVLRPRKEVVHPRDNPRGQAVFVGLEHVQPVTGQRIGSVPVEVSQLTGRKPRFYQGDIVYGYLRPYLNKLWIAEFDGLCSVDQYVYEVDGEKADRAFVAWFMRSPVYLERAPIDTTPGQLPRIRIAEVASVEINLPSLRQQKAIVAQIERELSETTTLKETLSARLAALDHFPAALLREAFNGRT